MNRSLRIGLQTGASFGVAMAVFAYFRTGRIAPALINAAGGIIFGAVMAWFSSRGKRRLRAKGIEAINLEPEQLRRVIYPGPAREACEATKEALKLVRKIESVKEAPTSLSLRAKTGFTFESFGENIVAEFSPTTAGTIIEISSKPRIFGTEMDMGRGVENVETIVKCLVARGASRRVA
jgi:hypothetical protein